MSWRPIKERYRNDDGKIVLVISPKPGKTRIAIDMDDPNTYDLFYGRILNWVGSYRRIMRYDNSITIGAYDKLSQDVRRWIVAVWKPGKNYGNEWITVTKENLKRLDDELEANK